MQWQVQFLPGNGRGGEARTEKTQNRHGRPNPGKRYSAAQMAAVEAGGIPGRRAAGVAVQAAGR